MTQRLAIHGGEPVIREPFPAYRSLGEEEAVAASRVLKSGVLSAYIGARGEAFMGGPEVRALEAEAATYFGVKHAIAVNSWTSGLITAVGVLDIEPGDEIIVTPWTMVASATAILMWNAIPVFADIDPETYNIDPRAVEAAITPRTRAIMAVDIFGQSADLPALRAIAVRHNLKIISDTAQAPGARIGKAYAGTVADIGGYSLNYHKHIHSGEGGIIVTNDDRLARRAQLIRNHGEAVIESEEPGELRNILGFNFRLGEIEAAIAREQLRKLASKVASRQRVVEQLREGLQGLEGLDLAHVAPGNTHVYYMLGMRLDIARIGVSRVDLAGALRAEGVTGLGVGYQNVHRFPLFRNGIAYGTSGFPWSGLEGQPKRPSTQPCPVAERLHECEFISLNICAHEFTQAETALVVDAFRKVWANLGELRQRG
ncbi:MAG: DegT/DnrJ/EryC1/StrS family aminotransferase [Steroidobacteraceae bacterium]